MPVVVLSDCSTCLCTYTCCHRTAGWKFFDAADVVDPDQEDGGEVYHFDLSDEVGAVHIRSKGA